MALLQRWRTSSVQSNSKYVYDTAHSFRKHEGHLFIAVTY